MSRKLLLRVSLTALGALAAFLILAPGGAAQTGQVDTSFTLGTVQDPAPITPDTGSATITVPWTFSLQVQPGSSLSLVASTATLQWDPPTCTNPGISITGSLSETIILNSGTGAPTSSWPGTSTFNVQASLQAPGEQPVQCTITGKVLANPGFKQSNPAPTQVNVRAAYLGLLSVNPSQTIAQAGPQKQITYALTITNLGNSESNVQFNLLTEDVGAWDPVVPTQVVLASPAKASEGTTQTVNFQISTPFKNGWNNAQKTFQLEITPVSTKDIDDTGQPVTVSVLARVRGVYVPTLEPFVAVAALGALAVVARRRAE